MLKPLFSRILNRKWIITMVVFICAITMIRLLWMNVLLTLEYTSKPEAVQGVLDMRNIPLTNSQTLSLNGQWEFFPSALPEPGKALSEATNNKIYIPVPSNWNHYQQDSGIGNLASGTYRLRILLDSANDQTLALRIQEIRSASAIYVNGQRVAGTGQPADISTQYVPSNLPYTVEIPKGTDEIELTIQVANHAGKGGITKSILFGTADAIQLRTTVSVGLQLLLCIFFIVHLVYAVILYFLGAGKKELLYFASMLTCAVMSVILVDDKLLFMFIHIDYEWSVRLAYLSYINVMVFMLLLIDALFPSYLGTGIKRIFILATSIYSALVLAAPIPYVYSMARLLSAVLIISAILSIYIFLKALRHKEDAIFLVLASLSVGSNIVWLFIGTPLSTGMHYPFDLMIAVMAFVAFWFKRFFRTINLNEQLVDQLRQEDRRKDEFLVNTSHELRNPLHGIINITQSIMEDDVDPVPAKHQERLDILLQVSKRMSVMLHDLLDITRLKERTIQLQCKPVRLESVVAGTVDMFRLMLNGKPLSLKIDIPDSFPAVHADENRLVQILFNLLHNAVKYTDQGSITIRARVSQGKAHIQVEDTGIGISKDALDKIFHPYEQASENEARAGGGFGLGLSICRQLVELHGGVLTVQSVVDKGSTFTFTLPLSSEASHDPFEVSKVNLPVTDVTLEAVSATAESQNMNAQEQDEERSGPKVLIVDDDAVNLNILSHILMSEHYEVIAVTDPEQALHELSQRPFDLVITDVMMPHISGYQLTSIIRERYSISELPVLLLTARSDSKDIWTGYEVGANDYICKPVDAMEIKVRVRALTDLKLSIEERLCMEGAWLQSQIQPHFLYNTINSIAALGVTDVTKMLKLLEEFSNYLRLSYDFHNSERVIHLNHELSLVRSYLYIEKERFGDRLHIEWRIEDKLRSVKVPPLSIQPLVENAVKHGIMKQAAGGIVRIAIEDRQEYIEISITDNGIGMTDEQREQLFKPANGPDNRRSVGLKNIDRRLKQLYGHGLIVRSKPGQGTTVSFHINSR